MNVSCTLEQLHNAAIAETEFYSTLQLMLIGVCFMALVSNFYLYCQLARNPNKNISPVEPIISSLDRLNLSINKMKPLLNLEQVIHSIYSCVFIVIQSIHFYNGLYDTGCNVLTPAWICIFFRIPLSFCTVFFQIFHFVAMIEVFAKFGSRRFREWKWSSVSTGTFMVVFSFLSVIGSFKVDFFSDTRIVNCASFESKTPSVKWLIFSFGFSFVAASVLLYTLMWRWNIDDKDSNETYNMQSGRKKRHEEMRAVLRLISPNFILSSVVFSYYVCINLLNKDSTNPLLFFLFYPIPLYNLLSPTVWNITILVRKIRAESKRKAGVTTRLPGKPEKKTISVVPNAVFRNVRVGVV